MLEYLAFAGYAALAALGFGFVIFIHELGHFAFAKWAGVRVDTFSIGFGKAVLRWKRGETEYVIAWLPLGGYVKMTGQEDTPSGKELDASDPASYLAKPALWKAAILFGGVLFNLISSLIILFALVAWGMPVLRPQVGGVHEYVQDHARSWVPSPASKLGLERGDVITAMNGETIRAFDDLVTATIFAGTDPVNLTVQRDGRTLDLPPAGSPPVTAVFDRQSGRMSLGIEFPDSNRVFAVENAPATGIRKGDRILAVAGRDVRDLPGQAIADVLLAHLDQSVPVTILRDGVEQTVQLTYGGANNALDTRVGLPVRILGIAGWADPSARALQPGDVVTEVDGVAVRGPEHFGSLVRAALVAGRPVALVCLRDGQRVTATVSGRTSYGVSRLGLGYAPIGAGVLPWLPPGELAKAGLKPGDALVEANPIEGGVRLGWISGERRVVDLTLDDAALQAANRPERPALWRRIFLLEKTPPPLVAELVGKRITAVEDTALVLHDGHRLQRSLFAPGTDLAAGDWLVALLPGAQPRVEVVRGGAAEPRRTEFTPPPLGTAVDFNREEIPYVPRSTGDAVGLVHDACYNLVVKTVQLFPRFFRAPEDGGIDPNKSLTGPIGIFRELKARAEMFGLASWIKLVALVGLNLFVVNLLPIPITDGGQLVFLAVETAMGRPLPMWLRNALMWSGVVLVGALFVYICGLDILRMIGLI